MAPLPHVSDFHHPYQPYEIQKQFMSALYECIEEGKVGIFESPTGTGKSLSLICGSLTWLRDHKRKVFEEGLTPVAGDDEEPDWMLEHARKEKRRNALQQRADLETRLAKIRAKEKRVKERYQNGEPQQKRPKTTPGGKVSEEEDDEAQFVLDDYDSDENSVQKAATNVSTDFGISAETQALMKKLGIGVGDAPAEEEAELEDELKIFFCSRTHSQLSQFAGELRRVKLPPAIPPDPSGEETKIETGLEEEVKHLTLGSRKNLCINPKVLKLGSATAINERCLELQQPGTSADHKCAYLPTKETEALVNDFRDHALAKIRDIEDLGMLGKRLGVCPYYASRPTIKPSEIVTLPYPLLLQKSAREALGLSLKGHVIIIDEAHNLMDAIAGIYSISVSLAQLQRSRAQIGMYLQKFRNRLKGKNRVYVTQTVRLLDSLAAYLSAQLSSKNIEGMVEAGDLLHGKGVDQINLYKLTRYLQESKLARKIEGYLVHNEQREQQQQKQTKRTTLTGGGGGQRRPDATIPVLTHIQGFLVALTNPSAEGRFFYSKTEDEGICLKYTLLDPQNRFREIVEEARAVVLAGGTMSPMSDYIQYLLSYLHPTRIMTLSCGHVIPASNLLACPVIQAQSGADFDFTFEKRNSDSMINDLGSAILSFIQHIPDGVVIFFPSYAYLNHVLSVWKKAPLQRKPHPASLYDRLAAQKPIFLEPRTTAASNSFASAAAAASSIDTTLAAYATAISSAPAHRGALLLSVVGGKLSEGINFSDALGRCVVVVGLPFPNPHSAEWKAKMAYVESKAATTTPLPGAGPAGKGAVAREYYENACMRAVNQCVGRAIRHKNDYAAILLVDRRFAMHRIQAKLPGWIRESLVGGSGRGGVADVGTSLKGFFEGKRGS